MLLVLRTWQVFLLHPMTKLKDFKGILNLGKEQYKHLYFIYFFFPLTTLNTVLGVTSVFGMKLFSHDAINSTHLLLNDQLKELFISV